MKEDYAGRRNIKGDNSREIIICAGRGISFVTHSSSSVLALLINFKISS